MKYALDIHSGYRNTNTGADDDSDHSRRVRIVLLNRTIGHLSHEWNTNEGLVAFLLTRTTHDCPGFIPFDVQWVPL